MATPTFAQLNTLSNSGTGFNAETIEERLLTCAAIFASGQNPDGSANPFTGGSGTAGQTITGWINANIAPYNADSTGTLDASGSIQAAINDAMANNLPTASSGTATIPAGTTVILGPGNYLINNPMQINSGVHFKGSGNASTLLTCNAAMSGRGVVETAGNTATTITTTSSSSGVIVLSGLAQGVNPCQNICVGQQVTNTALSGASPPYQINRIWKSSSTTLSLQLSPGGAPTWSNLSTTFVAQMGSGTVGGAYGYSIEDMSFYGGGLVAWALKLYCAIGAGQARNVRIHNFSAGGTQANGGGIYMEGDAALAGTGGSQFNNPGQEDTVLSQVWVTGTVGSGTAFYINGPHDGRFSDLFGSASNLGGPCLQVGNDAGGSQVGGQQFTHCHWSGGSGNYIGGNCQATYFTNCEFESPSTTGQTCLTINASGCQISGGSCYTGNAGNVIHGVQIGNTNAVTGCTIQGMMMGINGSNPITGNGITFTSDGGGNDIDVMGQFISGGSSAPYGAAGGKNHFTRLRVRTSGNYSNAVAAPAFPGTGVNTRNTTGSLVQAFINVNSAVLSAYTVDGITVTTTTWPNPVLLETDRQIQFSYTGGPPTWAWQGMG